MGGSGGGGSGVPTVCRPWRLRGFMQPTAADLQFFVVPFPLPDFPLRFLVKRSQLESTVSDQRQQHCSHWLHTCRAALCCIMHAHCTCTRSSTATEERRTGHRERRLTPHSALTDKPPKRNAKPDPPPPPPPPPPPITTTTSSELINPPPPDLRSQKATHTQCTPSTTHTHQSTSPPPPAAGYSSSSAPASENTLWGVATTSASRTCPARSWGVNFSCTKFASTTSSSFLVMW